MTWWSDGHTQLAQRDNEIDILVAFIKKQEAKFGCQIGTSFEHSKGIGTGGELNGLKSTPSPQLVSPRLVQSLETKLESQKIKGCDWTMQTKDPMHHKLEDQKKAFEM